MWLSNFSADFHTSSHLVNLVVCQMRSCDKDVILSHMDVYRKAVCLLVLCIEPSNQDRWSFHDSATSNYCCHMFTRCGLDDAPKHLHLCWDSLLKHVFLCILYSSLFFLLRFHKQGTWIVASVVLPECFNSHHFFRHDISNYVWMWHNLRYAFSRNKPPFLVWTRITCVPNVVEERQKKPS